MKIKRLFSALLFWMLACVFPAHASWVLDHYEVTNTCAWTDYHNNYPEPTILPNHGGYSAYLTSGTSITAKYTAEGTGGAYNSSRLGYSGSNMTYPGASVPVYLSVTPIFKRITSPGETTEGRQTIFYRETLIASSGRSHNTQGANSHQAGNAYQGQNLNVQMNIPGPWSAGGLAYSSLIYNGVPDYSTWVSNFTGTVLTEIKVSGTIARGQTRTFSGTISSNGVTLTGSGQESYAGDIRFNYQAEMANVGLNVTPLGPHTFLKNTPTEKETDGITRWKVKMTNDGVMEAPPGAVLNEAVDGQYNLFHLEPFISAQADFLAIAKTQAGGDLFSDQVYIWNAQKSPYLPVIPSPPAATQPTVILFKKSIDGIDKLWQLGNKIDPTKFNPFTNPTSHIPEFWEDALNTYNLASNAFQIPDTWKPDTSTPSKTFTWDFGPQFKKPPSTTVKVQVTGSGAGSRVINAGKAKLNWNLPKKKLYNVTIFPVEWQLEPGNSNFANFYYTWFSNEQLSADIALESTIQAISLLPEAGPVLGKALKSATTFRVVTNSSSNAGKVLDDLSSQLVKQAEELGQTEKASQTWKGQFKTEVHEVDEANVPRNGADADVASTIFEVEPKCFAAGTPVQMADGTLKPIDQVKVGDMVASKEPVSGKLSAKKVLRTFRNVASVLLTLTLSNGEKIATTPEHPFATSERGDFVVASELSVGKSLIADVSTKTKVKSEDFKYGKFPTFNFEVEDFHTYFVGNSHVWVHNACSGKLNKALGGVVGDHLQAHHLIPGELEPDGLIQRAINAGWDIDGASNGMLLPDNQALSTTMNLPVHNTNHPAYTADVLARLDAIRPAAAGWTDARLIQEINQIAAGLRNDLTAMGGSSATNLVRVPK